MVDLITPHHRLSLVVAALVAVVLLAIGPLPAVAQPHGFGREGMGESGMGEGSRGEMGGPMGMRGGGGQQQLYPSLMATPPADPVAREAALREAHRRMTSGLPLILSLIHI